jgi:hypothetical protein
MRRRAAGRLTALVGLLAIFGLSSCGQTSPPAGNLSNDSALHNSPDDLEYTFLRSELSLARTGKPYLVLDLKERRLELRLDGAIVWDYPMDFSTSDSASVRAFVRRFQGAESRLARPLIGKYLFDAADKTSDSVLAIVGRAVNVDPALLQRELPGRFQLHWDDYMILEIRSPVSGQPVSRFKNTIVEMRQLLLRPLGEISIVLQMEPDAALSLYRTAQPGMPTLIRPGPMPSGAAQ